MSLAEQITRRMGGSWHGTYGTYPGDGHSAKDRSISIKDADDKPEGVVINCHAPGDDWRNELDRLRAAGLLPPLNGTQRRTEPVRYIYRDASGEALYAKARVDRGDRKYEYQHLQNGAWRAGRGGAKPVPYRLPELMAAPADAVLYMAEGEKHADKLASWGLLATSLKDWRREFAEHVAGRRVIILPDNDADGAKQAADAAKLVSDAGGTPCIVELPGLPAAGDIMDWPGTAADLVRLVEEAKPQVALRAFQKGISAAELMQKQFQPVNYVIPGLVAEGATLFGGKPKIGKSWMAYDFAIAIANGMPVFGKIPVDQGDVLYLALEDSERRLRSRLLKKGVSAPERLTLVTDWPNLDSGCLAELEAWADAVKKPSLVIVDVLKMVRGVTRSTESLYDADYRALTGLASFARSRGLAVLIVHHVRKMEAEDPLESLSGTNGLTGAADTVMVLKRENTGQGTGHCILYVRGRDVEEAEKAVRFKPDNGTWELLGDAEEVGRTDERQAILDTLRRNANPMTVREISDVLGKPYDAVRKTCARMWSRDELIKSGRGTYACPVSPNGQTTPEPDNRTDRTGNVSSMDKHTGFPQGNPAFAPHRHSPILVPGDEDDEPFSRRAPGDIGGPLF